MERIIKPTYDELESYVENLQKQRADAQATIAALQARVQELETELGCPTWVCDCCGRVSSMGWINIVNETMDGIDYDMECPNCHTRQIEEDSAADLVRERDEFESQLTQRTAELEAANKLLYRKNCELGRFETMISDLQAELERVRGERDVWYARYNELSGVKDRQLNDLQAELERVRGERDNALESRDWWRAQLDKERAKLAATSQEG